MRTHSFLAAVVLCCSLFCAADDNKGWGQTLVDGVINSSDQVKATGALTRVTRREARSAMRQYARHNGVKLSKAAADYAENWRHAGEVLEQGGDVLKGINNLQNVVSVGNEVIKGDAVGATKKVKDVVLSDWAAAGGAKAGAYVGGAIAGPPGAAIGGLGGAITASIVYSAGIGPYLDKHIDDLDAKWQKSADEVRTRTRAEEQLRQDWEDYKIKRHIPAANADQYYEAFIAERTGQVPQYVQKLRDRLKDVDPGIDLPRRQPTPETVVDNRTIPGPSDEPSGYENRNWWPTTGYDFGFEPKSEGITSPGTQRPIRKTKKTSGGKPAKNDDLHRLANQLGWAIGQELVKGSSRVPAGNRSGGTTSGASNTGKPGKVKSLQITCAPSGGSVLHPLMKATFHVFAVTTAGKRLHVSKQAKWSFRRGARDRVTGISYKVHVTATYGGKTGTYTVWWSPSQNYRHGKFPFKNWKVGEKPVHKEATVRW